MDLQHLRDATLIKFGAYLKAEEEMVTDIEGAGLSDKTFVLAFHKTRQEYLEAETKWRLGLKELHGK